MPCDDDGWIKATVLLTKDPCAVLICTCTGGFPEPKAQVNQLTREEALPHVPVCTSTLGMCLQIK